MLLTTSRCYQVLCVMLHKVSLESLQKAALYGAVASIAGSSILYYLTQRNISSRPYFTEAVAALRNNQQACNLLGEPVRIKSLKLGMTENYIDTRQAQISIPVSGSRLSGMLHSSATVREGKWQVDRVVLKFNNTTEELCLLQQNRTGNRE